MPREVRGLVRVTRRLLLPADGGHAPGVAGSRAAGAARCLGVSPPLVSDTRLEGAQWGALLMCIPR